MKSDPVDMMPILVSHERYKNNYSKNVSMSPQINNSLTPQQNSEPVHTCRPQLPKILQTSSTKDHGDGFAGTTCQNNLNLYTPVSDRLSRSWIKPNFIHVHYGSRI